MAKTIIKRLNPEQVKRLGLKPKPRTQYGNPQYRISQKQLDQLDQGYSTPRQYMEHHKVDPETVSGMWIKPDNSASYYVKNPDFKALKETLEDLDLSVIEKLVKPVKVSPRTVKAKGYDFDRAVYTDVHVAMETNQDGFSLYGGVWGEEELQRRLKLFVNWILQHKKSNVLVIDELGDFMDGWDVMTVRRGHTLPQNMDNQKAFDVGLTFKVKMIDMLAAHYELIECHNVCEDNHSGAFGYVVNSAFKRIVEAKYKNVKVVNHRRFIEHYKLGKRVFILTHGKDSKNLKFGFKPQLDPAQIERINNYIHENYLLQKGVRIEFSKGDSHQKIFDDTTSDTFSYYNYMAFSPASQWVQVNFGKKGKSGFEFFNYRKDGQKNHHPYEFKWQTEKAK